MKADDVAYYCGNAEMRTKRLGDAEKMLKYVLKKSAVQECQQKFW